MRLSFRPVPTRAAVALAVLLLPVLAQAQAFDAVRLFGAAPGQDGRLAGLALISGTEYAGSDERRTRLFPALDYQWAHGWFAGTTNGIGVNLSDRRDLAYGLRLTADFGREEDDSDALRGMGDIDPALEFGGFANWEAGGGVFLTSSLRYGAGDDRDGVQLDLGAGWSTALAPRWRLGVGVTGTWTNAAFTQAYFGVTPGQAAASGYGVYAPGAGWRDVRTSAALTWQFAPRFSVTTVLGASRLFGDAADSPLVRDRTTVGGVVAVGYAF